MAIWRYRGFLLCLILVKRVEALLDSYKRGTRATKFALLQLTQFLLDVGIGYWNGWQW